jgi:hypothetical protein
MAGGWEVPLRQGLCRRQGCGAVFYVCRSCDRGQVYCSSDCRTAARRAQRRAANGRHQRSPEGRADHRDRQREYRRRLVARHVTDQGSDGLSSLPTLGGAVDGVPNQFAAMHVGALCCVVCGRRGALIDPWPR